MNIYEPLSVIIPEFLSRCEALSLDELSKIFSKLYEENKGFTLLKEIRDKLELEKTNYPPKPVGGEDQHPYPPIEIAGIPKNLIPQLLRKNSQCNPPTPENSTKHFQKSSSHPDTAVHESAFSEMSTDNTNQILYPIYKNLEEYLANEQWKKADLETMRLMMEIADSIEIPNDRERITWLEQKDINKIPDEALKTIDRLWLEYSNDRFGFSIQAKIWDECWGKQKPFELKIYREKFATRVGWSDGRSWIERYDNLDFSRNAKPGHLPSLSFPKQNTNEISWRSWQETFKCLFPRLFKLVNQAY
ncbi:GUN4 domain-containing protein [Okeania sp. KiyG1]|uniref:GUN4 domain-containing protein n=1 Tax=Okeania sp. KiyG1 TaxID=2720165 RepID=UPI0019248711|nr:GUN4 domain-containing protein [Okeania sp. KiyG1]